MVKNITELTKDSLLGKRVLLRVDFNVPLDSTGKITDNSRIVGALETIKLLQENEAKIILVSHFGRPKGEVKEELRLNPVAQELSNLLGKPVKKINHAVGESVKTEIETLQNGDIALLENIRFYAGEEKNDMNFAKDLADLADIYVNDAFGAAHRAHASTAGVASYISPALAGLLMAKEVEMLGAKLNSPERPFTAIVGGAKVSSKISVLKNLVKKVDTIIIGGGMAFTFLKAQGASIGQSICEEDHLQTAREILSIADQFDTAVILPEDTICCSAHTDIFAQCKPDDIIETEITESRSIPADMQALDIGPKSIEQFSKLIQQSKTIVWNGPLGVFEYKAFAQGTKATAESLAELTAKGGTTIIGGGDSVAALEKFAIEKSKFTHVSTGGGASLEFLEGKVLPGLACLDGYDDSNEASDSNEKPAVKFADELKKLSV